MIFNLGEDVPIIPADKEDSIWGWTFQEVTCMAVYNTRAINNIHIGDDQGGLCIYDY